MRAINFLRYFILFCSICILAVPLYIDPGVIYPYSFSKAIVFQILAEVTFAAYIILCAIDRSYRISWKHPLVLANSTFIILMLATSLVGVDSILSFWSTAQWMTGTILYIHFFAWFLVLSSVFKTWEEWRFLVWTSVVACFSVNIYGLAQSGGLEGVQAVDSSIRIYSLLGNPIYYAQYVLLNILLTLVLFLREKSIFFRILLCFLCVVSLATLFLSGTRSGILTLVVVVVCLALAYIVAMLKGRGRLIGFSLLSVAVGIFVGVFLFLNTAGGVHWSEKNLDYRTNRIVTKLIKDPARIELSRLAWHGFLERPVFGWGPNNYTYIFSTFVKPTDYGILFDSKWYDQPHNQVMGVASTMGVAGLLGYFSIWVVIAGLLVRGVRITESKKENFVLILLGLFFFSYFLQTLTAFDTVAPLIMLYFGFALVYMTTRSEKYIYHPINGQDDMRSHIPLPAIVIPVSFLLACTLVYINIIPYAKGRIAKKAVDVIAYDFDRGEQLFKKALSGASYTHEDVRSTLSKTALFLSGRSNISYERKKELLWFALTEQEKNLERHPLSLEYGLPLLELYRIYAEEYSDIVLSRAERLVDRLSLEYPRRRDVLYEKVFVARSKKDFSTAREGAQKIIALDPSRGESYWWSARIAVDEKRFSDFFAMVENARVRDYKIFSDGSIYVNVAAGVDLNDADRALGYIEESLRLTPNTLSFRAARAILLHRSGSKSKAQVDIAWVRQQDKEYARRIGRLYSPFSLKDDQ